MEASITAMRILLVDDVQLDRMQLAIRLKQLGHEVETAASGVEALQVCRDFEPELILMDISMPEMDGFEASKQIRQEFPDWMPIIFLSSHEEPEMIAQAIEAGGDDYLIKPVDKLVLRSKLIAMQRIAHMKRELKETSAKLEQLNKLLEQQANEDGLTQIYNRRFIDNEIENMMRWHARHQLPMTVILMDVDYFKLFNDNYGHIEGDKCLQRLAGVLKKCFTRAGEFVGRYGGEEFVVVLSNADEIRATKQAQRIKDALTQLSYPHAHSLVSEIVTVSQGVYSFVPDIKEELGYIYSQTDTALYEAKQAGRNRFVVYERE